MAKKKVKVPCHVTHQVLVIKVEVDVCNEGSLHGARMTMTDADDHTKVGTKEFPDVGEALDAVFFMLLKTKMQQGMGDAQLHAMTPAGNA